MKIFNSIPSKIIKDLDTTKYYLYMRLTNIFTHTINLYFVLTNKLKDDNIDYFILGMYSKDNEIDLKEYMTDNEYDIVLGTDFYVDNSILNIIEDLDEEYILNDFIVNDITINNDYEAINNGLDYYIYKNNKENIDMSLIYNFNQSFMHIILDNTNIDLTTYDALNTLYNYVINYYANGGVDNATILMNSIFNTTLETSPATSTCGCAQESTCVSSGASTINTGTETINLDTATCLDKYKAAMYQWLIKMLSDTNFYCCWMQDEDEDGDLISNDLLIDQLIDLLLGLINSDIDLSNLGNSNTGKCGCHSFSKSKGRHWDYVHNLKYGPDDKKTEGSSDKDCSDLDSNINAGCSIYSILNNYIKVLKWVKNNEIDENKNKIYIYGKQFAEIFPLLNF